MALEFCPGTVEIFMIHCGYALMSMEQWYPDAQGMNCAQGRSGTTLCVCYE